MKLNNKETIDWLGFVDFVFDKDEITEQDRYIYAHNAKIVILSIDEREACAIKTRFSSGLTLKETGKKLLKIQGYIKTPREGLTGNRARQILAKARCRLRHPSRIRIWKGLTKQ